MRTAVAFLLVTAGCEVVAVAAGPPDAEPDATPVEAGVDAPEVACVPPSKDTACVPSALTPKCDGGFRYSCYGSSCPVPEAGTCAVELSLVGARYTELCCERPACTRNPFNDAQKCARRDAGRDEGWVCPAGLKPAGDCTLDSDPVPGGGGEFCCR